MRTITSLEGIYKPMHRSGSKPFYGLDGGVARGLEAYNCDCDADFQRGYVWTELQQRKFIGHLLEGGDVAPILVNTGPGGDWETAILVDGKQRVTAALRWAAGEISALLYDGRTVWLKHLNEREHRRLTTVVGLEFGLVRWTREEMLENYIRLNRGGTVHTDDEIKKVQRLLKRERTKAETTK